jgi:hypothetical protein
MLGENFIVITVPVKCVSLILISDIFLIDVHATWRML